MEGRLKLLLLPGLGFIIFIIGTIIPTGSVIARDGFLATGTILVLIFYAITLVRVIRLFFLNPTKNIFWLIATICVPVIGNIIYVIFQETANRRQQPHGIW